jgi:hypothetical protein
MIECYGNAGRSITLVRYFRYSIFPLSLVPPWIFVIMAQHLGLFPRWLRALPLSLREILHFRITNASRVLGLGFGKEIGVAV